MSLWNAERTVEVYSLGICAASVCAPKDMPPEEVARIANQIAPTGISSEWAVSTDKTFQHGEPHPCRCESDHSKQHWLMVC